MAGGTSKLATRTVKTRRVEFTHDAADMPRHFVDHDLMMSHIMAVLSSAFPKGEDFFVDSVRNYRSQIDDPKLKSQVAGFIGQESLHGREHDRLNDTLQALGYPTKAIDSDIGRLFAVVRRTVPKPVQLAMTAALEHFTAVVAEQLLSDPAFEEINTPEEVRSLLRWHALEECEHKAVAFDAFQTVNGSEAVRIASMQFATALLLPFVVGAVVRSLAADRSARNPIRLVRSLANLRNSIFARRSTGLRLLAYNRVGFHPDDRDTDALLAKWREELFGTDGSLADRLS